MNNLDSDVLEEDAYILEENRKFIEAETSQTRAGVDTDKCCYTRDAKRREFKRDLRNGNPEAACLECDGYNVECPNYTPRQ